MQFANAGRFASNRSRVKGKISRIFAQGRQSYARYIDKLLIFGAEFPISIDDLQSIIINMPSRHRSTALYGHLARLGILLPHIVAYHNQFDLSCVRPEMLEYVISSCGELSNVQPVISFILRYCRYNLLTSQQRGDIIKRLATEKDLPMLLTVELGWYEYFNSPLQGEDFSLGTHLTVWCYLMKTLVAYENGQLELLLVITNLFNLLHYQLRRWPTLAACHTLSKYTTLLDLAHHFNSLPPHPAIPTCAKLCQVLSG